MASSRDRDAWTHIFKLYKSFPHLWDKKNVNYGNRSMMTDGYKILTRVYRERFDKLATVGTLRLKMKNLRTTYYRELRKIKDARSKGEKYTPSLWYFDHLSFLGSPKSKDSTGDSPPQNDNTEESISMQELIGAESFVPVDDLTLENSDMEYEAIPSTSQSKAKSRSEHRLPSSSHSERQDQSELVQKKDEHWEVIGKSIGYQLKDLTKKQYTIVSKLISDAIYFGRLNKLSEGSHIELGSPNYRDTQSTPTYASSGYNMGIQVVDVPSDHHQRTRFKHEGDMTEED